MITYADCSANDKIHFKNFVFFIVNNIFFLSLSEMARFESVGNVVEKLAVFVLLRVEEKSEVVKNIIKQVVNYDSSLNAPWQWIDELIVLLNLAKSIVGPKIFEMLVDLAVETVG